MDSGDNASECRDGLFGPAVLAKGCRGGFDFTLTFEESILTMTPAALFLILSLPRLYFLFKNRDRTSRRRTYTPKLIASFAYMALQVAMLAVVASTSAIRTRFSIAAAVLGLLASAAIVILSHAEHVKSIRPSVLLTAYLVVSLLFDAARARTEWLMASNNGVAAVLSTSIASKMTILVLESIEKRRILLSTGRSPSTESTSGPFSRGFFFWLNRLLISGWATVLTNKDLPTIYEEISSEKLLFRFTNAWRRAISKNKRPSLVLMTIWLLKWDILNIALPRAAVVAFSISRPFLISSALRYFGMDESDATANLGYGLIGAFALILVGSAIATAWFEHLTFRAVGMVRGGLIALVYQKMIKLPTDELNESSAMTLMGNDIETLVERLQDLMVDSWANSITVAIAMYLLANQLGAVCLVPIIIGIISLTVCGQLGKMQVKKQTVYQKATQGRINFTSQVIGSIKSVKMLGYTERFTNLISQTRRDEIDAGKDFRRINVWVNGIVTGGESISHVATFGTYAIIAKIAGKEPLTAPQVITVLAILDVLIIPLAQLSGTLPRAFGMIGCFKRIQDFLLLQNRHDRRVVHEVGRRHSQSTVREDGIELQDLSGDYSATAAISIVDGSFKWGDSTVLNDINTSIPNEEEGSLSFVIGSVGSGKSTFLKAILGETSAASGIVSLSSPEIAFCDQTAWIMNATIQDNIIAESKGLDKAWFNIVVDACDLAQDLAQLAEGALTIVGDKGLKLSGGQKQRLAIARAVYALKPVAIFDDVFSGLDKVTEQTVFRKVFSKTGLLQKHGVKVILATHAVYFLPQSDYIIALGDNGRVIEQGTFEKLRKGGSYVENLDISEQDDKTGDEVSTEDRIVDQSATSAAASGAEQEQERSSSDRSSFKYYFASMGYNILLFQIGAVIIVGFLPAFRSVWVTWWGEGYFRSQRDVGFYLSIYALFAAGDIGAIMLSLSLAMIIMAPISGRRLHSRILKAVMEAPMTSLSNIETGSLINRFSQDLRYVDIVLPISLTLFMFRVTGGFASFSLSIAALPWIGICVPIIMTLLVFIQRFYVRTSKQLRLLEIENKAPLYNHFLETMHGLATIRAMGWARQYSKKTLVKLDAAQKPAYLLNCIQRWLTLVLDLTVATLTIVMVATSVSLRSKINPNLLGVALVHLMNLGTDLKDLILQWSTLETSLGAISRIKTFCESIPSEIEPERSRIPDKDWLSRGNLEIVNVAVQYSEEAGPVVQKLSFNIKHGQNIGICGRSGSGKSSFIQALMRMADISAGQVLLDGADITDISKLLIRKKLSCLTQDPFLFTGSIRFNADPLEEYTDRQIISAMERVGMWSVITAKFGGEDRNPLDQKMSESSFSHGQRQLFCLARAVLKESSILILDEPTSSVDSKTDELIQHVIRTEFKDRTVIMIAHRLDTLLDFDKIAVLEKGELVEFDSPTVLLAKEEGVFATLYNADKSKSKPTGEASTAD